MKRRTGSREVVFYLLLGFVCGLLPNLTASEARADFASTVEGLLQQEGRSISVQASSAGITREALTRLSSVGGFDQSRVPTELGREVESELTRQIGGGNTDAAEIGRRVAQRVLDYFLRARLQGSVYSTSGSALDSRVLSGVFNAASATGGTGPDATAGGTFGIPATNIFDPSGKTDYYTGNNRYRSYVEAGAPCTGATCSAVSRPDTIIEETSPERERSLQILSGEGQNDLTEEYEGWSDYYKGYTRTPILFEPKPKISVEEANVSVEQKIAHLQKHYPTLADYKGQSQGELMAKKLSLTSINLGVDDEIRKTSMAVYKPLRWVEGDWADDTAGRDAHLNLFKTLRGVSALTLSYLDKTVAAGLATVQQQADSNSTNQLLKQISWTSKALASPNRAEVFIDTDEKVEYCLASAGSPSRSKRIVLDCSAKCGAAPENQKGIYSYCVCCAESTVKVNRTAYNSDQAPAGFEKERKSLVERVFAGTNLPTEDQSGGWEKYERVQNVIKNFKAMYGDLVLGEVQGGAGARAGEPGLELSLKFDPPSLSVPQQIDVIRNGCRSTYDSGGALVCPYSGATITLGICPALYKLIRYQNNKIIQTATSGMAPPAIQVGGESIDDAKLKEIWAEASLAYPLDARAVQNLLKLGNLPNGSQELSGDWLPDGALRRWTDSFCDASAVIVFRRLHIRMQSIAIQHMVLNQAATQSDKSRIAALMDRTSSEFALAEADAKANWAAEQQVTGISIQIDRESEAEIANNVSAQLAQMRNGAMAGSYAAWGNYQRVPAKPTGGANN